MKARCEKAEKEKSEILLRRLATMETMTNKTSTGEVAKLQKRNEGIHTSVYKMFIKLKFLTEFSYVPYYYIYYHIMLIISYFSTCARKEHIVGEDKNFGKRR